MCAYVDSPATQVEKAASLLRRRADEGDRQAFFLLGQLYFEEVTHVHPQIHTHTHTHTNTRIQYTGMHINLIQHRSTHRIFTLLLSCNGLYEEAKRVFDSLKAHDPRALFQMAVMRYDGLGAQSDQVCLRSEPWALH